MTTFFTDTTFKRIVNAERRVNQGLHSLELSANYAIPNYEYDFLRVTNAAAGAVTMELPDATTLPLGFDIKIERVAGPSVDVLLHGTSAPAGVLKAIELGKTYGFRLLENAAAAGTWLIYSVGEDAVLEAYVKPFNATSDWTDETTHWGLSVPATEHGQGTQPLVKVYELVSDASVPETFTLATNPGGVISAFAVDSATQTLYVGGSFTTLNGMATGSLAEINLTSGAVTDRSTGIVGAVKALSFLPTDNTLFIGGEITDGIVKMNAGVLSAVGTGVNGAVYAIKFNDDGVIYLGGDFTTAGGVSANRIARWDGTAFSALGSGCDDVVKAIRINGSEILVGGDFLNCGNIPTNHIAVWNGYLWKPFNVTTEQVVMSGSGANSTVYSIVVDDANDVMYVGGDFTRIMGISASRIAKINMTTLEVSPLGTGCDGIVKGIAVHPTNGRVYLTGDFTTADGVSSPNVTYWNGTTFVKPYENSDVGGAGTAIAIDHVNGFIHVGFGGQWLAVLTDSDTVYNTYPAVGPIAAIGVDFDGDNVYMSGTFELTGETSPLAYFARTGGTPAPFAGALGGTSTQGFSIAVRSGKVYFGGKFSMVGPVSAAGIAVLDVSSGVITQVGGGNSNDVTGISVLDTGEVYYSWANLGSSGGVIKYLSGVATPVASFNARARCLGGSTSGRVMVGGNFSTESYAGLTDLYMICYVKGNGVFRLGHLGGGFTSGGVSAMDYEAATNSLYIGGSFTTLLGVSATNIARIDLNTFEIFKLGTGCVGTVAAIKCDNLGKVYVGGSFTSAGGVANTARIACWNVATQSFSAVGLGCNNNSITTLCIDLLGNLFVGGTFTTISGVADTSRVAVWNGTAFSPLGTGCNGRVNTIAASPLTGDVFVGGEFASAGGVANTARIAQWNGSSFAALGGGIPVVANQHVNAINVDSKGVVYFGGSFLSAGPANTTRIARWDGSQFLPLGTGCSASVYSIAILNDVVYVGGDFETASGVTVNRVARWTGSTFVGLGTGCDSTVNALAAAGSSLFLSGSFSYLNNVKTRVLVRWNTAVDRAETVSKNYYDAFGVSSTVYDANSNTLYLAFSGTDRAFLGKTVSGYLGKLDMSTLVFSEISGPDNDVKALAVDATGGLYLGGAFSSVGVANTNKIAKWTSGTFSALATGLTTYAPYQGVEGLLLRGTDLYVCGSFPGAPGVASTASIAKYSTSTNTFSSVGALNVPGAMTTTAKVMEYHSATGRLYVGGGSMSFTYQMSMFLGYLSGSTYTSIYSDTNTFGEVTALYFDTTNLILYFGGFFGTLYATYPTQIPNTPFLAKWNGTAISSLGTGVDGYVTTILKYPTSSTLLISGNFTMAGGATANYITSWTGSAFANVGSLSGQANTSIWLDQSRAILSGTFTRVNGLQAGGFSIIDPTDTRTAAHLVRSVEDFSGTNGAVSAVESYGVDTFFGGSFSTAGVTSANNVVRWSGSTFAAMSGGVSGGAVQSLLWRDAESLLYVGGTFTGNIVTWDGSSFATKPQNAPTPVAAIGGDSFTTYQGSSFTYLVPGDSRLIPTGGDMTLSTSGDVSVRAENAPDLRFAGRIVVRT